MDSISGAMAELARIGDECEAAACADVYRAAPEEIGRVFGLQVQQVADATLLMAAHLPTPMFNRVIGLGLREPATRQTIREIATRYAAQRIADYWVHVTPTAEPAHLARKLLGAGFSYPSRRSWARMMHAGCQLPSLPCNALIRQVGAGEAQAAAQVAVRSFGMPADAALWLAALVGRPGWNCLVAEDDGAMAGVGYVYRQDDHAWLGIGGVLPEFRRRGIHGQLMLARIRLARDAGCAHITSETGEPVGDEPNPSLANMYRCGFERMVSRLNLAAPRT